jgi:acetate kinase
MKLMVLNSGSSSLRFQLIETSPEQIEKHADRVLGMGIVEKIGTAEAIITYRSLDGPRLKSSREILEHREAMNAALGCVTNSDGGVIASPDEIEGIGHRVVHADVGHTHQRGVAHRAGCPSLHSRNSASLSLRLERRI